MSPGHRLLVAQGQRHPEVPEGSRPTLLLLLASSYWEPQLLPRVWPPDLGPMSSASPMASVSLLCPQGKSCDKGRSFMVDAPESPATLAYRSIIQSKCPGVGLWVPSRQGGGSGFSDQEARSLWKVNVEN